MDPWNPGELEEHDSGGGGSVSNKQMYVRLLREGNQI